MFKCSLQVHGAAEDDK